MLTHFFEQAQNQQAKYKQKLENFLETININEVKRTI